MKYTKDTVCLSTTVLHNITPLDFCISSHCVDILLLCNIFTMICSIFVIIIANMQYF